jgi:hypothetical protein
MLIQNRTLHDRLKILKLRRMKVKFLLHYVLAIGVLAGCKVPHDDKETIVKVTPEFAIDLFEKLGEPREFQFKVATLEQLECTNYFISTNAALSFNRVTLNVIDLLAPNDCIAGLAPATGMAEVGALPLGYFNLDIHLKNAIENDGTLKVFQDSIVVDLDSQDGLEMAHEVLLRIPEHAIWGYTAYNNKDAGAGVANSFLSDLANMAETGEWAKGYYGYFRLDENNDLILSPPPNHTYFQTFLFTYHDDISGLEDMLRYYRTGPGGAAVEFAVFTGTGKTL